MTSKQHKQWARKRMDSPKKQAQLERGIAKLEKFWARVGIDYMGQTVAK